MGQTVTIGALNSGELTPLLDGRVDKEFYLSGAKTSENMIPLVQGPAMQRSGTGFVKEVKNSANRTALIPFEFNVEQAYVLEFGDQYMRVHRDHAPVTLTGQSITGITNANPAVLTYSGADTYANGDRVIITGVAGMIEVNNREFIVAGLNAGANTFQLQGVNSTTYGTYTSGGTVSEIYEIATPYLQADLFEADGRLRLQFAQQADVMYIVHPSYAPRKLSRTGHTSWTLSTATFSKGPFSAMNGDDTIRVLCDATAGTYQPGDAVAVQSNTAIFESGHAGMLFFMEEIYFDQLDVAPWEGSHPPGSVGAQKSNDGNVYSHVTNRGGITGSIPPLHTVGDAWDGVDEAGAGGESVKWRYLHSRWAIVQLDTFVDSKNMTGTISTYLCNGLASAALTITNVTNSGGLFRVTSAAHGYSEGDYVNISGVGGTTGANGDWKAINIATNTFDLAGSTFAGVYTAGGEAKRYSTWKWALGAFSAARGYPGVVAFHENRLVLAQTEEEPDGWWVSESASYDSFAQRSANQILATNSFRGDLANGQVNKIEWAFSMRDGLVMGTATGEWILEPAQTSAVLGPDNYRTRPTSNHGSRNVAPVRVDKTGFFVQRRGRKLRDMGYDPGVRDLIGTDLLVRAEHLTKTYALTHMAWVQEPDALLWCVRSDGALLSFTFQAEQNVYGWGRHILGGYSNSGDTAVPIVEAVCSIPAPDGLQNELWLIVNRYIDGGTKRYIEYLHPRWVPGDTLSGAKMSDSLLTYSGSAATTINGLWHLKGETVKVLADGRVHPNVVVDASGKITLNYSASLVQIGLAVRSRWQSVNLESLTRTGSAQGKNKIIGEVALRLVDCTNIKYGASFSDMIRHEFDTSVLDTAVTPFTGDINPNWPGSWEKTVFVCLENDYPVPFGIAAMFPDVTVTG